MGILVRIASAGSGGEVVGHLAQRGRVDSQRFNHANGLAGEASNLGPCALDSMHGGPGQLPRGTVLADCLAGVLGGLSLVDEVVDHLEHEADRLAPSGELLDRRFGRADRHGAHAARHADEGAGLVAMDFEQPRIPRQRWGESPERVQHLPVDHGSRRAGELRDHSIRVAGASRGGLEGKREKRVAGEYRHRLSAGDMKGGPTAPQAVVVECRKVVVHQAEGVHHLGRGGGVEGIFATPASDLGADERQQRTQTLAASEQGVVDCVAQVGDERGALDAAGEMRLDLGEQLGFTTENRGRLEKRHGPAQSRKSCGRAAHPYDAIVAFLWESFLAFMDRGGFVMWPLLVMSILMLALSIERAWFWIGVHGPRGRARFTRLIDALRRGQRDRVAAIHGEHHDPYTEMATELLRLGPTDPNAVAVSEEARPHFERFLATLGTIVTGAPLLGILGTVSGIIKSFALLGGRSMPDPAQVSHGIAEALVATASGLTLALATLMPYMIFRAQSDRAVGRMETLIATAQAGSSRIKAPEEGNPDEDERSGRPMAARTR